MLSCKECLSQRLDEYQKKFITHINTFIDARLLSKIIQAIRINVEKFIRDN